MVDRYTKIILTVIATALVYLCVVFTPLPGVYAQTNRARPGEATGPGEMVIVGWRIPPTEPIPVTVATPVAIGGTVHVSGSVTTERSSNRADRVMIAGWEEQASVDNNGRVRAFDSTKGIGLPVSR